jgi:predicted dehydrogenase
VRKTRTIANGPRDGEQVGVETPTTIHALLAFECGAIITLLASWDVCTNDHPIMELYGSEGTISIPDPNFFGGIVSVKERDDEEAVEHSWDHPFAVPNFEEVHANYRGAGLADMALSILAGRAHRCGPEFATHVIEVMTAILTAGETNQVLTMSTSCERPGPMGPEQARDLMA